MRKNNTSWVRMVLAFVAILCVAGPAMVLAGGGVGSAYPKPKSLAILGPNSVPYGGTATYTAKVTFTDGSSTIFTGPPVVFSASYGSITSNGVYTAPSSSVPNNKDAVKGSYSDQGVTVYGTKIITLTP